MIRRAAVDDAAAIAGVQVRAHQWAYRGLLPDALLDGQTPAQREPNWRGQLGDGSARHAFVAERDGGVIGFAIGGPAEDASLGADCGELYAMYQERDALGSGVGCALLAAVIDDLRARGFVRAVLWVLEGNARGRGFYEHAGWRADGTERRTLRDGQDRCELRYATQL